MTDNRMIPADPGTVGNRSADAIQASNAAAERWREHAKRMVALANDVSAKANALADGIEKHGSDLAAMTELFAAYAEDTHRVVADEHERLEAFTPIPKTNGAPRDEALRKLASAISDVAK